MPLVLEIDPPKELFEVDQDKVYALTINPNYLKSIRLARSRTLGMGPNARTSYSDMDHIRKELEYSSKLFLQNPRWPVVGEYNLCAALCHKVIQVVSSVKRIGDRESKFDSYRYSLHGLLFLVSLLGLFVGFHASLVHCELL